MLGYLWHKVMYSFAAGISVAGLSMRVEKRYGFPPHGPVLVVANHQSFLDPPLIGLAIGRPLVYLARKTLFKNAFFSGLIRSLGAVPIDQDGVGKEGIKTVLDELSKGQAVLVFPEGSRTHDGAMHAFKPGIHLLIKKSHAKVVPVGIAGAYDAWPIWRKYPHFSPLCLAATNAAIGVVIGRPMTSERLAAMPRDESLKLLAEHIASLHAGAEQIRRRA